MINVIVNTTGSISVDILSEETVSANVVSGSLLDIQISSPSTISVNTSILSIQKHGNEAHIEPFAEADMENVPVIDGGNL